jgi:hypothetical protein
VSEPDSQQYTQLMKLLKALILDLLKKYVFLVLFTYWKFKGRDSEASFLFANRHKSKSQIYQDLHIAIHCRRVSNSSNFLSNLGPPMV